jgi:hypothetical protein
VLGPPDATATDAARAADAAAVDAGAAADAGAATGPLRFYLAARGGTDANDGLAPDRPLRTLDRVHAILVATRPDRDIFVEVGAGTYACREMTTPWTFVNGHPIVIEAQSPVSSPASTSEGATARPVFSGLDDTGERCPRSNFLTVQHGHVAVRLTLRGLAIAGYRGALTFAGTSPGTTRVDQEIHVDNMVFTNIGDAYHRVVHADGTVLAGKGAILLRQTFGNTITNSVFRHVRNGDATAGQVHALYFTSLASRMVVTGNVFDDLSGGAIKISDYSSLNRFANNSFSRAPAAYVDRWCGALEDPATACGGEAQCPSWENIFELATNATTAILGAAVQVYPIPSGQTCRYAPLASGVRLRLGGAGTVTTRYP